jgi:hypothetical protein
LTVAKPDTFSGAEPDKIEQEVIRVVSAIPDDPANWVDPRSRISRFFLGSSKAADIDREIKERWTKEIVIRLVKVGQRLGYKVNDSHSVTCWRENWMYDIVWRDLREATIQKLVVYLSFLSAVGTIAIPAMLKWTH